MDSTKDLQKNIKNSLITVSCGTFMILFGFLILITILFGISWNLRMLIHSIIGCLSITIGCLSITIGCLTIVSGIMIMIYAEK